jgi:hypothetical protein
MKCRNMPIENILQFAKTIRLTCADCIYFKTQRCPNRNIILHSDNPNNCADGLLTRIVGTDAIIRQAETTIVKPVRFISSKNTKSELWNNFELSDQEIEALVLHIKLLAAKDQEKEDISPQQEPEIPQEQKDQALTLLKDPDILTKFLQHQDGYLVSDRNIRKLILFICCSAYGDYPLNLSLQQVFSAGKTTTATQTAKYFPNVWFLGSLSPKALIHQKSDFNEEKDGFIINLQKKILVFLDEPQLETLAMLKPLLSHDQFESEFRFVNKQSGETIKVVLRGFPAVIFCTTKSKYIMEFSSRWFTASPETSTEKIQKVIKAKGEKASQTDQPDPDFQVWRISFQLLSKEAPLKVIIPYANELAQCFRAKKPIDMRFFDLFLALIKATTILHAYQREKDQNGNLNATLEDYTEAYEVFHEIERTTVLGIGANVLEFYENIIKPLWETEMQGDKNLLSYEMLMWKFEEATEETMSRGTLRDSYLKPLEQKGLIDIEDDPKDKRRKTIALKGTIQETSLINDTEFKKRIAGRVG